MTDDVAEEIEFLSKSIRNLQKVYEIDDNDGDMLMRHFGRWRSRLPQHKNIQVAWTRYTLGIYGDSAALLTTEQKQDKWNTFLNVIRETELNDYSSPPIGSVKVADSNCLSY